LFIKILLFTPLLIIIVNGRNMNISTKNLDKIMIIPVLLALSSIIYVFYDAYTNYNIIYSKKYKKYYCDTLLDYL
jgi:hypothetical protein